MQPITKVANQQFSVVLMEFTAKEHRPVTLYKVSGEILSRWKNENFITSYSVSYTFFADLGVEMRKFLSQFHMVYEKVS